MSGSEHPDTRALWVVDRIEGETVVLVEDGSGRTAEVARSAIRVDVREGSTLRVPTTPSGALAWLSAEVDEQTRSAREQEGRAILDDLRGRDPGGDIEL